MILSTELSIKYAAFGPGESEDFISEFAHTFGLHHTNVILVELEVGSPELN
jgi:hypothetical protein